MKLTNEEGNTIVSTLDRAIEITETEPRTWQAEFAHNVINSIQAMTRMIDYQKQQIDLLLLILGKDQ